MKQIPQKYRTDVLIVFLDGSLGGTSRSAIYAGRAWARAGFRVHFYCPRPLPATRRAVLGTVGSLVAELSSEVVGAMDAIHFHHGLLRGEQLALAKELISYSNGPSPTRVPMITQNIFGSNDLVLEAWHGPLIRTTLGAWMTDVYRCNLWPARRPISVVPNAQDFEFFRPPSSTERANARRHLEFRRPTILRVGSPHPGKWSPEYLSLAGHCEREQVDLVCVGAPPELASQLATFRSVRIVNSIKDDLMLRNYYWAADAFSVNARQGESFGNVILEARGSGLPVVFRDRRWGDNTPREFTTIDGVTGATKQEWVDLSVKAVHGERYVDSSNAELMTYSVDAVALLLADLLRENSTAHAVTSRTPIRDRFAIAAVHNRGINFARSLTYRYRLSH